MNDGPYPKVHPRMLIVQQADAELGELVSNLSQTHDLTPSELFMLLGNQIRRLGQSCVVCERQEAEPKALCSNCGSPAVVHDCGIAGKTAVCIKCGNEDELGAE